MKLIIRFTFIALLAASIVGCTTLEEQLREDLTPEQVEEFASQSRDLSSLINAVYQNFRTPFQDQSRYWAMQEHTSDEVIGPTRGPDWDDNGIWRVLHNHTWDAEHLFVGNTFRELLEGTFNATDLLQFNPTPEQDAEARFLRAFLMAAVLDAWGQVPFRSPGEDLREAPNTLIENEATDFILQELDEIIANLPTGDATVANQDAANALRAKLYLNRGVYEARRTSPFNPTFTSADMDAVITACDAIINSGRYQLADNYFDNFAPNNTQISPELIFVNENLGGVSSGNVRSRWFCTLHYNQNPSGWNGFTTIADFYDTFDQTDPRTGGAAGDRPETAGKTGVGHGFLLGQQVDKDGNALEDRKGNALSYTREVALTEGGDNLEVTGIRVVKYIIDLDNGDNVDNDYVLYRYADILLMKAEALLRKGDEAGARAIVNEIRTKRGVAEIGTLTLDDLIAERGFELYWEGHRRQDLIRFGKFLDAWNEKPASGQERLLFPIPAADLAVNPNLEQNPGY